MRRVEVRFADSDLEAIEVDPRPKTNLDAAIVRAFRKVMNIIRGAADERGIRAWRSLRMKRLEGDRSHQHSLRLNDQWRLIVEIDERVSPHVIVVISIEDYH